MDLRNKKNSDCDYQVIQENSSVFELRGLRSHTLPLHPWTWMIRNQEVSEYSFTQWFCVQHEN